MTLNGNLLLDANDTLLANLDGTTPGSGYDQLVVNGTVTLGGAGRPTATTRPLRLTFATLPGPSGVLTLIDNNTAADAVTGKFAGKPQSSTFVAGGGAIYQVSFVGNDGNDVVLYGSSLTDPAFYGTPGGDTWLVQLNPAQTAVEVYLNSTLIYTATLPINSLTLDGLGGNDTFTVDYTNGKFELPGSVNLLGGAGTDTVTVTGNTFTAVTHTALDGDTGGLYYDDAGGAATITCDTMESPLDLSGSAATNFTFNLPAAGSAAVLEDDGGSNTFSQLRSSGGTFLTTLIPNPGNALAINRGNAADVLQTTALPHFTAGLTVGTPANPFATVTIANDLALSTGTEDLNIQAGTINVNGVTSIDGNVLLAATGDVVLNADVESTAGHLTVTAGDDVDQNADITTGTPGTVLVTAANGTLDGVGTDGIVMASGTATTATGSSVRLAATGESDIRLSQIVAVNVSLLAERDIVDNLAAETANVTATVLRLVADSNSNAAGQIGSGSDEIDTAVTTLAARAADGIYVREASGLTVDSTGAITVQQANFDSTLTAVTDASLSDLQTTDAGAIKVVVDAGPLTVNEGDADDTGVLAGSSGDVLLEATAGDVVLNADVESTTGHITLTAGDDVAQNADISTGTPGTVLVTAANGTVDGVGTDGIVMASGTTTTATGSSVRLAATGESDLRLSQIVAVNVSLLAERDIVDNLAAETANVTATVLRLVADSNSNAAGQIGSGSDEIDTAVTTLAARAADGIYVREANGLTVDSTGAITVQQANFDSTLTAVTDASLSDLQTTDAGAIKVVVDAGPLTVNEGDADDTGVLAGSSGDVLLEATAGDVVLNADVESTTGHLTVTAGDDVDAERGHHDRDAGDGAGDSGQRDAGRVVRDRDGVGDDDHGDGQQRAAVGDGRERPSAEPDRGREREPAGRAGHRGQPGGGDGERDGHGAAAGGGQQQQRGGPDRQRVRRDRHGGDDAGGACGGRDLRAGSQRPDGGLDGCDHGPAGELRLDADGGHRRQPVGSADDGRGSDQGGGGRGPVDGQRGRRGRHGRVGGQQRRRAAGSHGRRRGAECGCGEHDGPHHGDGRRRRGAERGHHDRDGGDGAGDGDQRDAGRVVRDRDGVGDGDHGDGQQRAAGGDGRERPSAEPDRGHEREPAGGAGHRGQPGGGERPT